MNVLVYQNQYELSSPKSEEKINSNSEKINDIRTSINSISDTVKGAKLKIEDIIKISSEETVKDQLKNMNLVFNTLNEDINKLNKKFDDLLNATNINKELNLDTNYIIAEININDEDINKDIKILSSYEESIRTHPNDYLRDDNFKNEIEIKQCEIKINDEIIPFNYYHQFKSKGTYIIKYSFKNNLKSTCLLFGRCKLLTKIDLSNLNTNNTKYMYFMFDECSSLTNINLSNINTNNVTNMSCIFSDCSSLTNINLSNFNTNNVTNMYGMFSGCSSLTNINLSNFNTNNDTDIQNIFKGCSKLRKENVITKDEKILNGLN